MKACPSFQFYPSDWLRDPGLRSCSLAARGLWIDMLAFMHEAEPYGQLRLNGKDIGLAALARMVGSALKETEHLLHELEDAGVFSRTEQGTIFSRRMVRDQILREKRGQYGHLSASNPSVPRKKDTQKDTSKDTFPLSFGGSPSSSSFSSSSEKKEKSEHPASPVSLNGSQAGFQIFWTAFPRKRNKGDAEKAWLKLKPDEVLLAKMLSKIDQAKQTADWKKEDGTFIPYPASWLNAKGWEDEYSVLTQRKGGLVL